MVRLLSEINTHGKHWVDDMEPVIKTARGQFAYKIVRFELNILDGFVALSTFDSEVERV